MKIHVYSLKSDLKELTYQTSLTGHSNSIRDFSFSMGKDPLLASCSQDKLIWLWSIKELTDQS